MWTAYIAKSMECGQHILLGAWNTVQFVEQYIVQCTPPPPTHHLHLQNCYWSHSNPQVWWVEPTNCQTVHTMFSWQLVTLDTEGFGVGLVVLAMVT